MISDKPIKPLRAKPPRESTVEAYLVDRVKALGGKTIKLAGAEAGTPDRLVALHQSAFLVEVKRPGEKLRPLQEARVAEWARAGISCYRVDSKLAVESVLAQRAVIAGAV